jgi:hypothetical protein
MAGAYPVRLETLAREAAFKLKRSAEYRASASVLLAECKLRVDDGDPEAHGAAWPEYCRVHFPSYSVHYIGRLIEAGAQPDDPNGQAHRAARKDAFDRAWAAFIALDLAGQREFLRCGAAYAIHPEEAPGRTAAEPDAEPPRALDWLA